jgi:ABC-type multidrug transport system ATPase subunit
VNLKLLARYVGQTDTHVPFLTVKETVSFAFANSTARDHEHGDRDD